MAGRSSTERSTSLRGRRLLEEPKLNRGVAFTTQEREIFDLVGLLPPNVLSLEQQVERAYGQYERQGSDLAKNVFLSLLQDRNEVLFYRLLHDHLGEMLPIVYTPTVGEAIKNYSGEYRGPRGVYLSVDHPDSLERSLEASDLGPDDVDLIVASDGEAILGIGDWGVGGIGISAGKIAVYVAAGGIDPDRALAVVLDVGTNRESLLEDPLYLGNRHPRVDQATYDRFISLYVETAARLFPRALLHWEDLAAGNARRILERYGDKVFTFNDDIQGTGAVTLAAVLSGLKVSGSPLGDQRIVIHGAGTAGVGIADELRKAMEAEGGHGARERFWALSSRGLLVDSDNQIADYQRPYARPAAEVEDYERDKKGRIGLLEVVRRVHPTILIGTSGQANSFTEQVVREMAAHVERPIILPMSNPTSLSEATPRDLLSWTDGRALVATGSPFAPVTVGSYTYVIGQANNALVFPGIGLGAVVAGASRVSARMIRAAADAVATEIDLSARGAPLLPEVEALRATSLSVATAVAWTALDEGLASAELPSKRDEIRVVVKEAMWAPEYLPITPA